MTNMLQKIRELLAAPDRQRDLASRRAEILGAGDHRLAMAVLLLHIANIDGLFLEVESAKIHDILRKHLDISEKAARELSEMASDNSLSSEEMQDFAIDILRHSSAERREEIVDVMWQVSIADGEVHEFEEALIARVGQLLRVPGERLDAMAQGYLSVIAKE